MVRLFPASPVWIALVRWGLAAHYLPKARVIDVSLKQEFMASVQLLAEWHQRETLARRHWSGSDLLILLAKVLTAVPDFESLSRLLTTTWTIGVSLSSASATAVRPQREPRRPTGSRGGEAPMAAHTVSAETAESFSDLSLESSSSIAQMCAHHHLFPRDLQVSVRQLARANVEAWERCLRPFYLSELLSVHADYPQHALVIRDAATYIQQWDGTPDNQLAAVSTLGFSNDKTLSTQLMRNLLQTTTPLKTLRLFPRLLQLLGSAVDGIAQLATKWVKTFLATAALAGAYRGYSESVAQLYGLIAEDWPAWTDAKLVMAFEQLRVEVLQLHRKQGLGGGMMLLEAAKLLGNRQPDFLFSEVFVEWMLPEALKKYFEERCLDRSGASQTAALQGSENACNILAALTRRDPRSPDEIIVPSELCEEVLLCLLDVLQPAVPRAGMPLLLYLLSCVSIDVAGREFRFWPRMLRLTNESSATAGLNVVSRLRKHRLLDRIRTTMAELAEQLRARSIVFDLAMSFLAESRKDKHHTLWLYLREVSSTFALEASTSGLVNQVLDQAIELQHSYDALEYFRTTYCLRAPDHEELSSEIKRVVNAVENGAQLNVAVTEEHWGIMLSQQMRDVAASTYRLKNSLLFRDQWQIAERSIADEASGAQAEPTAAGSDPPSLSVSVLVDRVYSAATNAFQTNCKRMLSAEEPITLKEVAHIFGTPLKQADAEALKASLPTELRLMFLGGEPTPDEQGALPFPVLVLHDQLLDFAGLRRTLTDATALRGLVANVVDVDDAEAEPTEVQALADELVALGELQDGELCSTRPLRELSDATQRFYKILLPTHKDALSAADQIGRKDAREVLTFIKDLDDHDLRDLMDSGSDDKSDVVDAMSSLARAHAILRPILRSPPHRLIGGPEGALEVLGAAMRANHNVNGVELAGDVEICIANLHALTHRNKGMGDQAKDSIRAIVECGTFTFRDGLLEVRCFGLQPFDAVKLSDLRSHALLGIGGRAKEVAGSSSAAAGKDESDSERQTAEHFLQLIAASESIAESIAELRMLGHYGVYTLSLQVSSLAQLQELQQAKAKECNDWRNAVHEAREKHYLLSFFASRQLWELYVCECGTEELRSRQAKFQGQLLSYVPSVNGSTAGFGRGQNQLSTASASSHAAESIDLITPPSSPGPEVEVVEEVEEVEAQMDCADGTTYQGGALSIDTAIEQLHQLGAALDARFHGARPRRRKVNGWSRKHPPLVGAGTVCFVRRSNVLETLLALYAVDGELPAHCQLLFCGSGTTQEEIAAFLHRAFHAEECDLTRGKLLCVLRIGELSESLYLHFKQRLERLYETVRYQTGRTVRLALVCDEREQHRISSDFATFVKEVEPQVLPRPQVEEALRGQRHVVVVTSERAGLGKTRTIDALAQGRACRRLRTVAISGLTTRGELVDTILEAMDSEANGGGEVDALHLNILDVPVSCASEVNDMLFEVLCLGMIRSSATSDASLALVPSGAVFIELANVVGGGEAGLLERVPILSFFDGPHRVHLRWDPAANPFVLSPAATTETQMVCRYLQALDNNSIQDDVAEQNLTAAACWGLLDRHFIQRLAAAGQQPSFAQLRVFVSVLADQLRRFQESGAFMSFIVREVGQPNVRAVVARCLVDAAARFATRSVGDGTSASRAAGSAAESIARQMRVQTFESVDYMLLLMQKDMAITVFPGPTMFGQVAAEVRRYYDAQRQLTGQALAPLAEWRQIPQKLPDDQLRGGRTDLLNELINFLGADVRRDQLRQEFDRLRYTLTADNALKMMLVHVRICAGEPVVICGETGCGKTSLIKFLLRLLGKVDRSHTLHFSSPALHPAARFLCVQSSQPNSLIQYSCALASLSPRSPMNPSRSSTCTLASVSGESLRLYASVRRWRGAHPQRCGCSSMR